MKHYIVGSKCCAATYANDPRDTTGVVNAQAMECGMSDALPVSTRGFGLVRLVLLHNVPSGGEIFLSYGGTYDIVRADSPTLSSTDDNQPQDSGQITSEQVVVERNESDTSDLEEQAASKRARIA